MVKKDPPPKKEEVDERRMLSTEVVPFGKKMYMGHFPENWTKEGAAFLMK